MYYTVHRGDTVQHNVPQCTIEELKYYIVYHSVDTVVCSFVHGHLRFDSGDRQSSTILSRMSNDNINICSMEIKRDGKNEHTR